MNYVSIALGLLQAFLGNNPTVQEIEEIVPALMSAFANEKAGQAFSVNIPISLGGVKGVTTVQWAPSGANQNSPQTGSAAVLPSG